MPVKLLTVPGNVLPSAYGSNIANLRTLASALAGISQNVAINQAGEGFSVEMPDIQSIAKFINAGDVYIEYCGWPLWWSWINNGWFNSDEAPGGTIGQPGETILKLFDAINVDSAYISGFGGNQCLGEEFGCPPCELQNYPYDRGADSAYIFPISGSVITAPLSTAKTLIGSCQYNTGSGSILTYYAYSVIGVKSPSGGWYFWAYSKTSGAIVDPTAYANFIRQALSSTGTGTGSGTGSGTAPGGNPPTGGGGGFLSNLTATEKVAGVAAILALIASGIFLFGGGGD